MLCDEAGADLAPYGEEMAAPPDVADRIMALAHLQRHPDHRPPLIWRVVVATVLAIVLCLAADAGLVALGTRIFPATRGYVHFQFGDYARLTVVGIVIAGAAWPVVARVSSAPRWLFVRLAVVVSAVLLLPDFYIWHQGQPIRAVAVLMCMHIAIGVITYTSLVRVAPTRPPRLAVV
jgi:hypothetical protein